MKRRLKEGAQMVSLAAAVSAAELGVAWVLRLCWAGIPTPVLWLMLAQFGGMGVFLLTIIFAHKKSLSGFFLLFLILLSSLAVSISIAMMFPAFCWGNCILLYLFGGMLGLFAAACIVASDDVREQEEEGCALAVRAE